MLPLYKKHRLVNYLGDYLLSYYKKDNPSEQSIWNSDSVRLNYIIKKIVDKNNSIWVPDQKGIITTESIIKPLLKYLGDYIDQFIKSFYKIYLENLDPRKREYRDLCNKSAIICEMYTEITDSKFEDKLNRYIAPQLYLKRLDSKNIIDDEDISSEELDIVYSNSPEICFIND